MDPTQRTLAGSHGDLAVHVWAGADPSYVVLLAHGVAEHARRYDHVAAAFVADGAVVYAPDHYGHGRSAGEPGVIDSIDDMARDLHGVADAARTDHPGLPVVLVGHSLGGLIGTRFLQLYPGEVAATVLSGPFVGGNPQFEALLGMDPMPEVPLDPAALSRDPAVGEAYAADPLVHHGPIRRDSLEATLAAVRAVAEGPAYAMPVLWLHGELDPLAPYDVTKVAVERIAGDHLQQKVYPGAMHEIFNETNQAEVIGDAVAFVRAQLAR